MVCRYSRIVCALKEISTPQYFMMSVIRMA